MTKTTYTVERIKSSDIYSLENNEMWDYLMEVGPYLTQKFDNAFDYRTCPFSSLADRYIFLVCRRNGKITGHMICNLFTSPLDSTVKILYQVSFHAKPDSGRTAYHLFQKFLDIGKTRANHVITQLTSQTNIKPATLEKMGFKEMETLYRLET